MNCYKYQGQVAPHKAMLLIAVMEEIAKGHITNGIVPLSDTMVRAFESAWKRYVGHSSVFNPMFSTPFFHLGNEPFWELMKSNHYIAKREYSLGALRESFFGAKLQNDLFGYMKDAASRKLLMRALIEMYVPNWDGNECAKRVAESETEYDTNTSGKSFRMAA